MVMLLVLLLAAQASAFYTFSEDHIFKPCPTLNPYADLDVTEIKGKWHLSLVMVDGASSGGEDERDVCLSGDILVTNSTHLRQQWEVSSPRGSSEPAASLDLTATLVRPGVWLVQTPLGGKVKATIFGYLKDTYLLVAHCGWLGGELVHLWTGVISRGPSLTSLSRHAVSSALADNGFDPAATKVITWNTYC